MGDLGGKMGIGGGQMFAHWGKGGWGMGDGGFFGGAGRWCMRILEEENEKTPHRRFHPWKPYGEFAFASAFDGPAYCFRTGVLGQYPSHRFQSRYRRWCGRGLAGKRAAALFIFDIEIMMCSTFPIKANAFYFFFSTDPRQMKNFVPVQFEIFCQSPSGFFMKTNR